MKNKFSSVLQGEVLNSSGDGNFPSFTFGDS
jgi:hypothetical protein